MPPECVPVASLAFSITTGPAQGECRSNSHADSTVLLTADGQANSTTVRALGGAPSNVHGTLAQNGAPGRAVHTIRWTVGPGSGDAFFCEAAANGTERNVWIIQSVVGSLNVKCR